MSVISSKLAFIRSRRVHHPAMRSCEDGEVVSENFKVADEYHVWEILHLGDQIYAIKSKAQGGYVMSMPDGSVKCSVRGRYVGKNRCQDTEINNKKWTIEMFSDGYVAFKSFFGKYLSCNDELHLTANRESCELGEQWALLAHDNDFTTSLRYVEMDECRAVKLAIIRSRRVHHPAMRSCEDGEVVVENFEVADDNHVWEVLHLDDQIYAIKSKARGTYVMSTSDGSVKCQVTEINDWEKWTIEMFSDGYVAFKSFFGKYLSYEDGLHLTANRESCELGEQWALLAHDNDFATSLRCVKMDEYRAVIRTRRLHHPAMRRPKDGEVVADGFGMIICDYWDVIHLGGDSYAIRTCKHVSKDKGHGRYLGATHDGKVTCDAEEVLDLERWTIESTDKCYVSFKSCFGKYLCCSKDFRVTADREECGLWEQWSILDNDFYLNTPSRMVYIRSCRNELFRKSDGLPALHYDLIEKLRINLYGNASNSSRWSVFCIEEDKIALLHNFSQKGFSLSTNEDGDVMCDGNGDFSLDKTQIWTVEQVEGAPNGTIALKSVYGRYLTCDSRFSCFGSVKANSEHCIDDCTHWVFHTDPHRLTKAGAIAKDEILRKNYNDEYA